MTLSMADSTPDNDLTVPTTASPLDAYQPPAALRSTPLGAASADLTSAAWTSSDARPRGLKVLCTVVIILGAAGLVSTAFGVAALWLGQRAETMFFVGDQPGAPQHLRELNAQMQREMLAVQSRFWTVNVGLLGIHAVVATGLLVGGIQVLRQFRRGRRVLIAACGLAIAFELARGVVQSLLQIQAMSVMQAYFEEMTQISMNEAAQAAEWVARAAQMAMLFGAVLMIVWILAKLVFYTGSVWYLGTARVREYLDSISPTVVPSAADGPSSSGGDSPG